MPIYFIIGVCLGGGGACLGYWITSKLMPPPPPQVDLTSTLRAANEHLWQYRKWRDRFNDEVARQELEMHGLQASMCVSCDDEIR